MPDTDVRDLIRQEARKAGIPEAFALAVAEQESSFNPGAIGPEITEGSAKGQRARGIFQFIPSTAQRFKIDPDDPVQNVQGGVRYLRELLDQHQGDPEAALREYGGVVRNTTYVPGVLARMPKFQPGATPPPLTVAAPPPAPAPSRIGPGPSRATRISRVATPVVGAVAGGIKGAAVGAPAGPLGAGLGAVVGAGLGAGAGELLQSGFEYLVGERPPTPSGIARRVGTATQTGMVGEVTGRGATAVAGRVLRPLAQPFARKTESYAGEALRTFTPPGGKAAVLPAEITSSRVLDVFQNVAEGSLLGGGRIVGVREARQKLAEQKVLDVLDQLGPRVVPKEAGQAVLTGRKAAIRQFRQQETPLWEAFRESAKDIPAETPRLDAFIGELTEQEAGRVIPSTGVTVARRVGALSGAPGSFADAPIRVSGVKTAVEELPKSVQDAIASAIGAPPGPTLSAAQFQKTVSNLGALSRQLERAAQTDPTKNADLGLVRHLYNLAQDDLAEMAAKGGPEVLAAHEQARVFSRLGNERLFNESLRRLARADPEKVVDRLLTRNRSTAITAVKEAVEPADFTQVQSVALQRLIAPNSRTGRMNWGEITARLDRAGDDTIGTLFPGDHAKEIRRVADLMLKLGQSKTGVGKLAVQFSQAGSIIGLATGTLPEASGTVLLAPAILARIFSNPTALRWLSVGLRAPKGSREAITAATQVVGFLGREVEEEEPTVGVPPSRALGAGPVSGVGGPPPAP